METCPNCGQPVRGDHALCPFCGAGMQTEASNGKGAESDRSAVTNAGTIGCALAGIIYWFCGACYVETGNLLFAARHGHPQWGTAAHLLALRHEYLWLGFGLPVLLTGLPYLLLRRRSPAAARGMGVACLAALAIALGAPFICGGSG